MMRYWLMNSLKRQWKYSRKLQTLLMCQIPMAMALPQSIKMIEKMHLLMQYLLMMQ